jgi:hypothetical protein
MILAKTKRWRKVWLSANFGAWWKRHKKPGHLRKQLEVPKPWRHKIYKGLNRVVVGRVLGTRSAHGDFADTMSGLTMTRN